jgi:Cu(I)/Ag(I) efflux system membrane fusion protein
MELVPADDGDSSAQPTPGHTGHAANDEPEVLGYACAMNCVPPLEEPGACPICGMEMQQVVEDRSAGPIDGDPNRRFSMSEAAKALASIQTSPVVSRVPVRMVRLVGELVVREDTIAHISADVGGRIDKLTARFEGDVVRQGEELVLLYSPELLAVQQEFLQARSALERLSETTSEALRRASANTVEAARERLRLGGLSPSQIDEIADAGVAQEQVTINAPIGGTVIERHVQEGQYVAKGEPILTIARLDSLWAEMAAYETDLAWLRLDQSVTFTSPAYPGEEFTGYVAWIDPVTSLRTRTTRVRLHVENERGMLRPGMFLTARVQSTLGDEPMLIIPASAPLITGERAVVYLQDPDADRPTFQGVEVVLGPRVTDGYVVREGLEEGQMVVTNGAFQIDSALQIIARSSMMSPQGGVAMDGHAGHGASGASARDHEEHGQPDAEPINREFHPEKALTRLSTDTLITDYLHIQRALATDDFDHARHGWSRLGSNAGSNLPPPSDIHELRRLFKSLSDYTIERVRESDGAGERRIRLVHCPMAFDFAGADWLQATEEVRNPYFGAEMLTCGTVKQEWSGHD